MAQHNLNDTCQHILILQFAGYHTQTYAHFFEHIPTLSLGELPTNGLDICNKTTWLEKGRR